MDDGAGYGYKHVLNGMKHIAHPTGHLFFSSNFKCHRDTHEFMPWMFVNIKASSILVHIHVVWKVEPPRCVPLRWMLMALPLTGSCDGNLFCFLQLPIKTGASFHLNGFFELSSNRRASHKKWTAERC